MRNKARKIAIVGSGIVGTLATFFLLRDGLQVLWFKGTGGAASRAAGAMVCTLSEWDNLIGQSSASALLEVRIRGSSLLRQVVREHRVAEATMSPLQIVLGKHQPESQEFEKLLQHLGIQHARTASGVALNSEFGIDSITFLNELGMRIERDSNLSVIAADVQNIDEATSGVTLITSDGTYSAHAVALCTGHKIEALASSIDFQHGVSSYALRGLSLRVPSLVVDTRRLLNENAGCGIHSVALANGAFFGATSTLALSGQAETSSFAEVTTLLENIRLTYGEAFRVSDRTQFSAGFRSITQDRLPKFCISRSGQVVAVYGLYRNGFAYAPVVSAALSSFFATGKHDEIFPTESAAFEAFRDQRTRLLKQPASRVAHYLTQHYQIADVFPLIESMDHARQAT